jgi:hypothetical protein
VSVPLLIDYGVEINTIDKIVALKYGLEELTNIILLILKLLDSRLSAYFYTY